MRIQIYFRLAKTWVFSPDFKIKSYQSSSLLLITIWFLIGVVFHWGFDEDLDFNFDVVPPHCMIQDSNNWRMEMNYKSMYMVSLVMQLILSCILVVKIIVA